MPPDAAPELRAQDRLGCLRLGEILVDGSRVHTFVYGGPWQGPGQPVPLGVTVPNDPSLVGAVIFAQGLMLDPRPEATLPVALAGAAYIRVGF